MRRSSPYPARAATTGDRETACGFPRSRDRSFCRTPSRTLRGDAPLRRGRALLESRARREKAEARAASRQRSRSSSSFLVPAQQSTTFDGQKIEWIRAQALEELQPRRTRFRKSPDRHLCDAKTVFHRGVKIFDVVHAAVDVLQRGQCMRGIAAKRLESALRVAEPAR